MKNIYDLKLHEGAKQTGEGIDLEITRVPGGWIYNFLTKTEVLTKTETLDSETGEVLKTKTGAHEDVWKTNLVFVPYNKEFISGECEGTTSPSPDVEE
jgi:hypothetical protein